MIDTPALELWDALQQEAARRRQIPTATYRVQFNREFTFKDATAQIPYWQALGISHVYASPFFRARPESMHGYDICDHNALNPSIGTEDEFNAFVAALHEHGLGQILDTVPNHMGIGECSNHYWMDVLENGPSSPYASFFDIDWQPLKTEMANQVLLPILGDQYGRVLEKQELRLSFEGGAFYLHYYETQLPVAPRSYTPVLELVLERIGETAAPDDEHVLELQSIMTAITHLPPRTETDPARIAERHREKEIIKRRLNALVEDSPTVRAALDAVVTLYNGEAGNARSFDRLDELVRAQAYRLAYWRVAAEEINYRRFFDINDLAAIRMERIPVFEATHQLIFRLLAAGSINGLRIDHPDGLWDPAGYFRNLQRYYLLTLARRQFEEQDSPDEEAWETTKQELLQRYDEAWREDPHSAMAQPLYVVAEKILGHGEILPSTWPVNGTSGYDFLNLVNGLFVDGANAKTFEGIYSTFIKQRTNFNELVLAKKRQIMLISLASEINVLARQLSRLAERNRNVRDFTINSLTFALREVIASFPVYRTYIADGNITPSDVQYIEAAVASTKRRTPVTDPSIFDFIRDVLLLRYPGTADEEDRRLQQDWVQKFQQVTGPVMAKGLEDTAFYIYNRLISLNEVGGEPQHFGTSVAEFHKANLERRRSWPHAMLTLSTHDTKRSADVRARINALSELPKEWKSALTRWSRLNSRHRSKVEGRSAPDRNEEYLFYQTLLGMWPRKALDAAEHAALVERIQEYMRKALKEAKVNTSWVNPNEAWDAAVSNFVSRALADTPQNAFLADFKQLAARLAQLGVYNALAQSVIELTVPGVPDIYQGNEAWDFSLVDPDNRRPVPYTRNREMLNELDAQLNNAESDPAAYVRSLVTQQDDGGIKLLLVAQTLRFRREQPELFAEGEYVPLETTGNLANHVVGFARRLNDAEVLVVAPRLLVRIVTDDNAPIGDVWSGTSLLVPAAETGTTYLNLFTHERVQVDNSVRGTGLPLAAVFGNCPIAVLVKSTQ